MPRFCRTGKRTTLGLLKDGYNSLVRYFYNNFSDGFRQVKIRIKIVKGERVEPYVKESYRYIYNNNIILIIILLTKKKKFF